MKIILAAILSFIAAGFVVVAVRRPPNEYPLAPSPSRMQRADFQPVSPARLDQAGLQVPPCLGPAQSPPSPTRMSARPRGRTAYAGSTEWKRACPECIAVLPSQPSLEPGGLVPVADIEPQSMARPASSSPDKLGPLLQPRQVVPVARVPLTPTALEPQSAQGTGPCLLTQGLLNGGGGANGTETPRPRIVTRRLFDAIRWVESNDDDRAIGDSGRSVGPYQCGRAAWLDGGGRAEDYPRLAHDRAVTEAVMVRYWQRYGAASDEDKAKCWNVGPRWRTRARAAGDVYWQKVNMRIREK